MCKQAAVYWPPGTKNDEGQTTPGVAQEVKCRWDDVNETFIDAQGRTRTSKAKVYVLIDMEPGGYLWLSSLKASAVGSGAVLAELTDETDPNGNTNAWEIHGFSKMPDRRANDFLRTAIL
jgi:hypothetical protein